jgi:hypothetical protein
VPSDRVAAFDAWRAGAGSGLAADYDAARRTQRDKKAAVKALALEVNQAKTCVWRSGVSGEERPRCARRPPPFRARHSCARRDIDDLSAKLDATRSSASTSAPTVPEGEGAPDGAGADASATTLDASAELAAQLAQRKAAYRAAFDRLREAKDDLEYVGSHADACRTAMLEAFAKTSSADGAGGAGGAAAAPAPTPTPTPTSAPEPASAPAPAAEAPAPTPRSEADAAAEGARAYAAAQELGAGRAAEAQRQRRASGLERAEWKS